ncbi:MAG TPA: sugar phosphate isomerase/epimerase family protein [Lacipirellulaceae bacterium]|nr:sugar phosphate isomerase/epimerase family protein [Lacipirellulaceae bacterium]
MAGSFDRRAFLKSAAATGAVIGLGTARQSLLFAAEEGKPLFEISLAEWSLHRTINDGKLDNLDFSALAKNEFGIEDVEYVNQFFKDKARDAKYLAELNKRAKDNGVNNVLIMIDGEGSLGDPDAAKRTEAVENHYKWVEAAKTLGCHSIRVNAHSEGSYDEQMKLAADGLGRLNEFGAKHGIGVIVENHGGLSSNGAWLAGVMKMVGHENCGTLPDFGNFRVSDREEYDRYKGVKELMPFAKGVSAKSHEFDAQGNEVRTDYDRMIKIVLDAGYRGYIGIEWEGDRPGEIEGIRLTQRLLERVRDRLATERNV